jgi:ribosome-associated toxin RatA of RatAB toxin-antitoxin module
MVRLTIERPVAVAPEDAWPVVVEMDAWVDEVPGLDAVEVREATDGRTRAEWTLVMRGSSLRWTQENEIDPADRSIRFRMVAGHPRHLEGRWRVIGQDGPTLLRLEMDFEFGLPAISEVLDPVFERTMTAIVESLAVKADQASVGPAPGPAVRLADALVTAIARVVPPDVVVEPSTPLDRTTLDSLGLLEAMVHLEDLTGLGFDERTVRAVALDAGYDPTMSVAELAELLLRSAPATAWADGERGERGERDERGEGRGSPERREGRERRESEVSP